MNILIGYDKWGHPLKEGDICKYKITHSETQATYEYRGMVLYDDSEFSFIFEQTTDDFPIVLMNQVKRNTIELLLNVRAIDKDFPEYEKWVVIYNSNLGIL